MNRLLIALLVVLLHTPGPLLHAGGYQLTEQATPALGLAGVGQSAIACDASTCYYNPAGMARLCDHQYLIGIQGFRNDIRFKKDPGTPFAGGTGGQIGSTMGSPAAYFVNHFNDCVSFGFCTNSPFGAGLNYSRHWTGRYVVQSDFLLSLSFIPSVAIRINPKVSIGGGFIVNYSHLWQSLALNPALFQAPPNAGDGRFELELDSWDTAFLLGALWEVCSTTRIGLTYFSVLRHKFDGPGKVTPPNDTISGTTFAIDTNFIAPQTANISLYHQFSCPIAIMFDVGFSNYADFERQVIATDSGGQITIPRKMKDIWHFGVATQMCLTNRLRYQLGFAYDTSPQTSPFRFPDLPLDKQYRYGTGFLYEWNECVTIGTAFEYINFGRNKMRNRLVQGEFKANNSYWLNFTLNRRY